MVGNVTYPPPQGPFSNPDLFGGAQGMFGGLRRGFQAGGNALHPYSNRLMLAGMGMLGGGPKEAMRGLVAGSALDTEDADRRKLNKALADLMNDPNSALVGNLGEADKGYLMADQDAMHALIGARLKPADFPGTWDEYVLTTDTPTKEGFNAFLDKKGARSGVSIYTGDYKVPTGYKPVDPNDPSAGVEKIPGVETETVTNRKASVKAAVSSIDSQLARYEELAGKYGVEAIPGPAKDQLLTVRRGIQLQLKELFNLGVLNGPDLQLMDTMLWDPSVGGDISNVPSQTYTAVTGGAAERAKTSAAELRRIIKSIQNSVEGKSQEETDAGRPASDLDALRQKYGLE